MKYYLAFEKFGRVKWQDIVVVYPDYFDLKKLHMLRHRILLKTPQNSVHQISFCET